MGEINERIGCTSAADCVISLVQLGIVAHSLAAFLCAILMSPPWDCTSWANLKNNVARMEVNARALQCHGVILGVGPRVAPRLGFAQILSLRDFVDRNRSDLCDLRVRCPSQTPEIASGF